MSGTPTSLFRFPSVASAAPRVARIAASISFVVVLPFEPATAATGIPKRRRWNAASAPSARSASSTSKSGSPGTAGVPRRTTAAPAPFVFASARNACASKRSPFSATKSAPAGIARVSVETDPKAAGAPAGTTAPVARATSAAVKDGSVEAVARLREDVVHDGGQALRPLEDLELPVGARPALHDRADVLDLAARAQARRRRRRRTSSSSSMRSRERHLLLLAEVDELAVDAVARGAPLVLLMSARE